MRSQMGMLLKMHKFSPLNIIRKYIISDTAGALNKTLHNTNMHITNLRPVNDPLSFHYASLYRLFRNIYGHIVAEIISATEEDQGMF